MRGQATHILRWPLWSWRNLSVTAAAVLLVLYGVGRVVEPAGITGSKAQGPMVTASPVSSQPSDPAPATSPARPPVSVPGVSVPGPSKKPTSSAASGVGDREIATRVATAFARAWSYPGRSQQEWIRGIQPFVTPALAAGLAQTDPARVPATKVTGEAVLLKASATSARVRVPTDGGSIAVTLHRTSSGPWKVSDVAPADQPPGAPTPNLQPPASLARS